VVAGGVVGLGRLEHRRGGPPADPRHHVDAVIRDGVVLEVPLEEPAVELGGLLAEALVLHLRVRLRHVSVELVALHRGEVAVRELVVLVLALEPLEPVSAVGSGDAFLAGFQKKKEDADSGAAASRPATPNRRSSSALRTRRTSSTFTPVGLKLPIACHSERSTRLREVSSRTPHRSEPSASGAAPHREQA
jgi:hypothetical protein